MCTTAQTLAGLISDDRLLAPASAGRIRTMLFIVAAVIAAATAAAVMFYKARGARRVSPADLGRMSAQWLAEHSASDLS